MFKELIENMSM